MNGNAGIFKKRNYSNVIGTCFFDKDCIARREASEQEAAMRLQQQQQLIMEIANKKVGGLSAWAIAGIVLAIITITAATVYYIKKQKK